MAGGEGQDREIRPAARKSDGRCAGIQCQGVGKIFGVGRSLLKPLRGVNFSVHEGEFVSLLGPSGCGKSTLLMMVGGLEPVTEGSIALGGTAVTGPRAETGIIFQDPTLLPWKSALDNVLFPIDLMRARVRPTEARALAAAHDGPGGRRGEKPSQLSGGMRQRVVDLPGADQGSGVHADGRPFSALDAITRDDMNMPMLYLWEHYRKTALFVTHSIREAVLLSDRVLVMGGRAVNRDRGRGYSVCTAAGLRSHRNCPNSTPFARICARKSTIRASRGRPKLN